MPSPESRDEVIAISNRVADEAGIPRVLLLAAGVAESNLNPTARRPRDLSQDAAYWTDVSHGTWQQTVRWSQEYRDWYTSTGHAPAQFPGSDITEAIGSLYYDVEHAARVAARQLKAHYRPAEDDAIFRALCRYNWPAGDGAPKGPGQAANYRRGITEAESILGATPMPPSTIAYEEMRSPHVAGRFAGTPRGVVLHGSRSGRAGNPKDAEYRGTANWAVSNPDGLSWHITCGMGKVAVHLTPQEWGWHALQASKVYLGCEFAQATAGEPIADEQVAAFADWFKTRVLPAWPGIPLHFPSHAEVDREFNQQQGKSDVHPLGSPEMENLRARIMARLEAPQPVPEPGYVVGPGILSKMQEHGEAPASDELYFKQGTRDEWSEAFSNSGARYIYLPSINRVFRYEPAA